jgi:protein-tyrosine kinase
MSRIHEALRKAEQERASRSPESAASIVDTTPVDTPAAVQEPATAPASLPLAGPFQTEEVSLLEKLRQKGNPQDWNQETRFAVFDKDGRSPAAAEQFRTLRSRLYRLREKQTCRRVLVTSSLPAEGKTFVAANLAGAIARQHERHALLIDADLRASRLHLELGAPSTPGLSEYLRGEADEVTVVHCSPEGNLFFIPGGKPVANPAELLAGARLKNLLDRMTPVFDWVVLDSPPVLPVSDAGILAGLCDGVLLVVRAGQTPFDAARKAASEFRSKNLIGVVLNRAEKGESYSSAYYYNSYPSDRKE